MNIWICLQKIAVFMGGSHYFSWIAKDKFDKLLKYKNGVKEIVLFVDVKLELYF